MLSRQGEWAGYVLPGAKIPQFLDMSVALAFKGLPPSLLSFTNKFCGRSLAAVASPACLLLIPAFTGFFHGSVLAVGVCGP